MSEKIYSMVTGIVIQNNDPEKRGRVKVFIPHLSTELYADWDKEKIDKKFVFPDAATNPDLDKILPYLKQTLPWAEQASPLFGGNSSGRYNGFTKVGSSSDSNSWEIKNGEETHIEGFRPLQSYTDENRVNDAFSKTDENNNRTTNPHSFNFTPSNYSNLARGHFTIPNVGAHVWVFFEGGDQNFPVVFASSHGQDDWTRIYTQNKSSDGEFVSEDYPESYENLSSDETQGGASDHNIRTFRSKDVFNSNKHTLEFVDTDNKEAIKLTHYNGSFKEFNNFAVSEFAQHNSQSMVLNDQFRTVKGNDSFFVGGNSENIIYGDSYNTYGDYNKVKELTQTIYERLYLLHKVKRLFEVKRTNFLGETSVSELQFKAGVPNVCPTCQGMGFKYILPCVTCKGTGLSPSTQDGIYIPEPLKWVPMGAVWPWWENTAQAWCMAGRGIVWDQAIMMFRNVASIPIPKDATYPIIPPEQWVRLFPPMDKSVEFPITFLERTTQREIMDLEAKLGDGGDKIDEIAGSVTTTIGTVFNDFESYRIDPVGKIRPTRTYIDPLCTYVAMKELPLVEYVDVDNMPGGDYTLTVCNKYTLTVGSKGVHLKTTGPLEMYGTIVNLTGESVNISSENEVCIDGGDYLELRASNISIKPHVDIKQTETANMIPRTSDGYVMLDGNVGVKNNLTVVGGAHIEGELSCIHMQAPDFRYMTEVAYGPLPHVHVYHAPPWLLHSPYIGLAQPVRLAQNDLNEPIAKPNIYSPARWVPI